MADSQEQSGVPVCIRLPREEKRHHAVEAAKDEETRSDRLRRLIEKGEAAERDEARRPQHREAA